MSTEITEITQKPMKPKIRRYYVVKCSLCGKTYSPGVDVHACLINYSSK